MARLDDDLTTVSFSTCLGGSARDEGWNVAVADGSAFVVGSTTSRDDDPTTSARETPFPTTKGAYDRTCGDGSCMYEDEDGRHAAPDGFVARLTPRR